MSETQPELNFDQQNDSSNNVSKSSKETTAMMNIFRRSPSQSPILHRRPSSVSPFRENSIALDRDSSVPRSTSTSFPSQSESKLIYQSTHVSSSRSIKLESTASIFEKKYSSGSATGNPRNKCSLKPGHSLMDWIRLGGSGLDLSGTKGSVVIVSHKELTKHCQRTDAWLAIRGRVYNVTKYMDFHPGGIDELMRGVGKDATKIFEEVHAWVNYEQLLAKCYIGPLRNTTTITFDDVVSTNNLRIDGIATTKSAGATPKVSPTKSQQSIQSNSAFKSPSSSVLLPFLNIVVPSVARKSQSSTAVTDRRTPDSAYDRENEQEVSIPEIIPRYDWIQKTSNFTMVFYTKTCCNPAVLVENLCNDCDINIRISIDHRIQHLFEFKLTDAIKWPPDLLRVSNETGKIEISFTKIEPKLWTNFGLLERRKITDFPKYFYDYKIVNCLPINHDSYAIVLHPERRIVQHIPIGYHVSITASVAGIDVTRSYTPVPTYYLPDRCANTCLPLLVKHYANGILSTLLTQSMSSEAKLTHLQVSHPKGSLRLMRLKNHCRLGILAAGSGITPMLSIIDYLLNRISKKIELIHLLLLNKREADIWCRQKLELMSLNDDRLKLTYILSDSIGDETCVYHSGHVSEKIIEGLIRMDNNIETEQSSQFVTFCMICGPAPFNKLCAELFQSAGFDSNCIHIFQG